MCGTYSDFGRAINNSALVTDFMPVLYGTLNKYASAAEEFP